ncbi:MAG: hypothetical protein V3V04_04160 [Rhizobiaceae bacterium]
MMIRITDTALLCIAVAGAIWTYQVKHEAELSAKRLNTIKAQIAAQDRKIALLEADWAIETSPARLEQIAKKYSKQLTLHPLESSQIIDATELPGFRIDRSDEEQKVYAGENNDLTTGGIDALIEKGNGN